MLVTDRRLNKAEGLAGDFGLPLEKTRDVGYNR
jgi:hypothetical protein